MIFSFLALVITLAFEISRHKMDESSHVKSFLERTLSTLRSGNTLPLQKRQNIESKNILALDIENTVIETVITGESITERIDLMLKHLNFSIRLKRDSRKVWLIAIRRQILMMALVTLVRWRYLPAWGVVFPAGDDQILCMLASLNFLFILVAFLRFIPKCWLTEYSSAARQWCSALITLKSEKDGLFHENLTRLENAEFKNGFSLKRDKIQIMDEYAMTTNSTEKRRLKTCEDSIGILEFLC
ncbi:MAG: hypothetical protein HQK54_15140, partial [Oligoflexales bacterium]|nr:hypothetical protein [Oligoflexales bacterium]